MTEIDVKNWSNGAVVKTLSFDEYREKHEKFSVLAKPLIDNKLRIYEMAGMKIEIKQGHADKFDPDFSDLQKQLLAQIDDAINQAFHSVFGVHPEEMATYPAKEKTVPCGGIMGLIRNVTA